MSGGIGGVYGPADYGMLDALIAASAAARQQVDKLTEQSATGRLADTYAGLGAGASVSLDLRPQLAAIANWQSNIDAASGRMQMSQTVLSQLSQIATTFSADLDTLQTGSAMQVDTVAAQARDALKQVADLLNTTNGGVYLFAGQDSANPPVPAGDQILTGSFYTQTAAAVSGLAANGAAATAAATLAIATGNSPFSATMGTALPTVQVDQSQQVAIGIIANVNAVAVQTGSSTTGSYTADLMRALATIGSLTGSQASLGTSYTGLIADTRTSLQGAIRALATDTAMLGSRQAELAGIRTNLGDASTALTAQISSVEDVDMAATATRLSAAQTQLQASYQLIAGMKNLSLVNYL